MFFKSPHVFIVINASQIGTSHLRHVKKNRHIALDPVAIGVGCELVTDESEW